MKRIVVSHRSRKLLIATSLATLALLGLLITLALAQTEIPSAASAAYIQTSGPNASLETGDWYSRGDQGNQPHNFSIFVPCTIASSQVLTLELFDPEVFLPPAGGAVAVDEIRPEPPDNANADDTTFRLLAPDGSLIASQTYPPSATTNDTWVLFTTFRVGDAGCGIYTLQTRTSDNDDNAWRLRITHPDEVSGSGDEPTLAAFETSFQHGAPPDTLTCQDFYFFVPQTPSIRLNNFDLDYNVPGYLPVPTLTYFPPAGGSPPSSLSGNAVWNGGDASNRGGDVINNPQWGWWRAEICVGPGNQYIFEPQGLTYVLEQPQVPDMTLSKDDGLTTVTPGQTITYTIVYQNNGEGAALNTTLTEILPANTMFVRCSGGLSCALVGPGTVTYTVGTVASGDGGQVTLTVQVDPATPPLTELTNTARLEYEDVMFNRYPPVEATDVDVVLGGVDLQINKTDGGIMTDPGGVVAYTLTYTNVGTVDAAGVVITETVPPNTTFNETASAPTAWSCPDGSSSGTVCTTDIGSVATNGGGSVTFAVTVDDPLPSNVTQIANTAVIRDDGANGSDPTPDNNVSSDTTPIHNPVREPTSTPSSKKKEKESEAEPTLTPTPPAAPAQLPAPTATPAVLFLPETGEGGPPAGPSWWSLALFVPILLAGWVIHHRRRV